MRVLFLDDDSVVLSDGLADLDEQRFRVDLCTTVAAAMTALQDEGGSITPDDVVLFVDHDLGGGQEGYEFVEWVRRGHQRGHLLPIVYLTGRESERGYIKRQANRPYHSPSLYLSKLDFARASFDVNQFIDELVGKFEQGVEEIERQRLEHTIRFFETLPDAGSSLDYD